MKKALMIAVAMAAFGARAEKAKVYDHEHDGAWSVSAQKSVLAGRAPDYADKTGKDWLFNHDIAAKRYECEPAADPGVDLFYLYPTSVLESDDHCVDGICDIDDPYLRGPYGAILSWKVTGAVYGDFTRVYAPYYRQTPVDFETMIGDQPDANANMRQYWYEHAPYEDVTNALTHYFTKINPDGKRPFILAGHSHGSGMLSLVMEHFFAEDPARKAWLKNMVACYAIGWGVSKDWEAKLNDDLDMYVATNATDAGVYVFWNTYGGPDSSAYASTLLYPADAAPSVNPILWTRAATNAPASLNLGGWVTNRFDMVLPRLYDASNNVERGTIVCTAPELVSQYIPEDPGYGRYSLHTWDCRAYWENLRENGFTRYAAFADLKPVSTNNIPTVADTTWKVTVNGQEAAKSPVDCTYYVAANASKVKLVYALDPAKASEGCYFANGETTTSFPMQKEGGVWVSTATKAEIEAETKSGKPTVLLGVVAQRYPWDGKLDVQYWAKYTPNKGYLIKIMVELPDGRVEFQTVDARNGKNAIFFDMRAAFGEVAVKGAKVTAELMNVVH